MPRSCLSLLLPLAGATLLAASAAFAQTTPATGKGAESKAATNAPKAHRPPTTLDLSTPHVPQRRVVTHGAGRPDDTPLKTQNLGAVDVGEGELRLDGGRKSRDLAHDVTGFDQTPGSSTFRQLAPSQKSGTPPYVGFTFSRPNN